MPSRIEILQKKMQERGIAAAVIMYSRNLYYYAGTAQPCNLFVPAEGEPVLFVRRAMDFVKLETNLQNLIPGGSFRDVKAKLDELGIKEGVIGFEEEVIPAALYIKMSKHLSGFNLTNILPLIFEQRMVKEEKEISLLKKAASIYKYAHESILKILRPGISELEVGGKVYEAIRTAEADFWNFATRWDLLYPAEGIIAGSKTSWKISGHAMTVTGIGLSPALRWGPSPEKLEEGDLMVIDLLINYRGYQADISRTYSVGKANAKQKEIAGAVCSILDILVSSVKPGLTAEEVYEIAKSKAVELGVFENLQGYGDMKGEYVGHGLGLEFDEPPTLAPGDSTILQEGMVLAFEPKLIIPNWGAIDIEETVLITANGVEVLTPVERKLFEVY